MKHILRLGAMLIVLVCLFPPWIQTVHGGQVRSETPVGYALIFKPPKPERDGAAFGIIMDTNRLLCELGVVVAVLSITWTFIRKRNT